MKTDSKKTINAAVAGLGIGELHARQYAEMDGCNLVALYDPEQEKSTRLAEELDAQVADSFEALLDESVDVVTIASPDDCHAKQILAAFAAGKHVFCEKPLCNTYEELKQISAAWHEAGGQLKIASNLVLRTAPLFVWLKEQIDDGMLGEIYSFDAEYLYGRLHKITHGWRGKAENYSGMKGGGVHLIDLMLWLSGHRPAKVSTVAGEICTRDSDVNVHDYMAATFQFESGMSARICANLGSVHRHQHVLRIYGTQGTFILDDMGPRVHLSRDPALSPNMIKLNNLPITKTELGKTFINAIRDQKETHEQTQRIFDAVSILGACDASLASGNSEEVHYL